MQILQLAHESLRGGASPVVRSQAEPGNEDFKLSFAEKLTLSENKRITFRLARFYTGIAEWFRLG
jgi:hypothetical protein